jgi:hypothetical protein
MRRWDRMVDAYLEEYRTRGTCDATVAHTAARLARWGGWMKSRRPRPAIEEIDADLHKGKLLVERPLSERREILADILPRNDHISLSVVGTSSSQMYKFVKAPRSRGHRRQTNGRRL